MASLQEMLRFPDPVNETSARVVAGGVLAMATATVVLDQPWILVPLTYGFAARLASGPTLSPLGQLATKVVTPRLNVEHRYSPGAPKRLAQGLGLAMSATASLLVFGWGRKTAAYRVLGALIAASGLESIFGFCVACKIFPLLVRAGLARESACEECVGFAPTADDPVSVPEGAVTAS